MIIKKAIINNFKSIEHIELDFDKVGDSYTKIFVGLNESGKSNILEALSYYNAPEGNYKFEELCNQKCVDDITCLDITFHLDFEETGNYNDHFKKSFKIHPDFYFELKNVTKKIYLQEGSNSFVSQFSWEIEIPQEKFIINRNIPISYREVREYEIDKQVNITAGITDIIEDEILTKENFAQKYNGFIETYIKDHEPKVSIWNSSDKYLITDVDLNGYAKNINSNKTLKNIFNLGGYKSDGKITGAISKIHTSKDRSRLKSKLQSALNENINEIWGNNNIEFEIGIAETGKFSILVKDKGKENENERFTMSDRSLGAKHFLSLILSLSLETKNQERKNELILIDEPEVHLHPSGIRDLSKELLKIGQNNHVFLATHSPFIIDKQHKTRHYIVKKNNRAMTEITRIKETDSFTDDEVLNEAFGINVYRDLLNPHSVLVEGASDKTILKKTFKCLGKDDIGIINGHGSNIVNLSSKMDHDGISLLVIVDDDNDGKNHKEKIIKIGGIYSENNVFTIRDLVGDIILNGTIEDTLDPGFVRKSFHEFLKEEKKQIQFSLTEGTPIISQIESVLKRKENMSKQDIDYTMDSFKKYLSEQFNPTKKSLSNKNKLLKELAEKINEKLKGNTCINQDEA